MYALSMIPPISYAFLILFFGCSVWHIFLCLKRGEGMLRKVTKCFCVLFLSIAVMFAIPKYPLIYIGLLCGTLGDFLLLFKKRVYLFVFGVIFFMLNHTLCITQVLIYIAPLSVSQWIIIGSVMLIAYIGGLIFVLKILKKKRRAIPASFYVFALLANIIAYSSASLLGYYAYFMICIFGAISFLISDMMLAYSLFVSGTKQSRHLVMGSYLIAQFLIALGFMMTFIG